MVLKYTIQCAVFLKLLLASIDKLWVRGVNKFNVYLIDPIQPH